MSLKQPGDEPTPVKPTPLDEAIFGGEQSPDDDTTRPLGRPAAQPYLEPAGPVEQAGQTGASDAAPDDWWQPVQPAPVPQRPTYQAPPVHQSPAAYQQPTYEPSAPAPVMMSGADATQPPRRRGIGPLATVLLLVGAVVLGALLAVAALRLLGGDDTGTAGPPRTTTGSTRAPTSSSTSSPSSATTSSSTSESSSSSTTAERTNELPAGATECSGPKDGVAVGRTTEVTTCPFAQAVREAYLATSPGDDGSATLSVRSPVTGRRYTMRCTGAVVTTCRGGDNASVVLY